MKQFFSRAHSLRGLGRLTGVGFVFVVSLLQALRDYYSQDRPVQLDMAEGTPKCPLHMLSKDLCKGNKRQFGSQSLEKKLGLMSIHG